MSSYEIFPATGGVTAALGFEASGVHCGMYKDPEKLDLALIVSSAPASAVAVYTQNLVKGAPLAVTKAHLGNGKAQAMICNSGNANTCNADGIEKAQLTCDKVAEALTEAGVAELSGDDVIVASTGVIGVPLPVEKILDALPALVDGLWPSDEAAHQAASAIMTTDTVSKEVAIAFNIDGVTCHMGGMAKGSGMIHPNMATMLVFITTDCAIESAALQQALSEDVVDSFNMISVDGDTSTNDMLSIMANGLAGNETITVDSPTFPTFKTALSVVTRTLCKAIAADGEGASKTIVCEVTGAADAQTARTVAKSVICSSLVKTAIFGEDANWGRILCAIGYSGADLDVSTIACSLASDAGCISVCEHGAGVPFSEEFAAQILAEKEIRILIDLGSGDAQATAWGCDLSYEYVRINGDYRS